MGGDAVPMAGEQRIQAHGAGDVVKEVPSSFFVPVVGSCGDINCRISNKFLLLHKRDNFRLSNVTSGKRSTNACPKLL